MQRVLRLFLGLVILTFAAGSTSAAIACVEMPIATASAEMPADCPDHSTTSSKHDGTAACVPMCAAITPAVAPVALPAAIASRPIIPASHAELAWSAKPEPPPPRAG
jgi:zona occludens toxin (predicted ATPase)